MAKFCLQFDISTFKYKIASSQSLIAITRFFEGLSKKGNKRLQKVTLFGTDF
jgi:hypothetical protein